MSIDSATKFIRNMASNTNERDKLYNELDSGSLESCLEKIGYSFSDNEFEEAFNALHVKCQTHEEANVLHEIRNWFSFIKAMSAS
jgi:hypothetical protein